MFLIQPVAFDIRIDSNTMKILSDRLFRNFGSESSIAEPLEPPVSALNRQRNQFVSDSILRWLLQLHKNNVNANTKILAVCDIDAYSGSLNFVFGQAHLGGKAAAIYLPRLREEFYGLSPNRALFYERVVKEATHELGHAFGLPHCRKSICVMYFSNTLRDTDLKGDAFCESCKERLDSSGK